MEQLSLKAPPPAPDSMAMLLVAVNLLMLSFFVLLNAMATPPTTATKKHSNNVLAEVREGYDMLAAKVAENGTTPMVPTASWAEALAQQLQGVVVNRLQLNSVPLTADANRVVLVLPARSLFAEQELVAAETIRALLLAAQGSTLRWELQGPLVSLAGRGGALANLTGQVALLPTAPAQPEQAQLKLIVTPGPLTLPSSGNGLESLTRSVGGSSSGQADGQADGQTTGPTR